MPRLVLKEQWEKLLIEWKINNAEVFVVNTYIKESRTCDLLIQDELHLQIANDAINFNKSLHETNFKYYLGLSATIEKHFKKILEDKGIKCACQITFAEGINNQWISPVLEYNIFLDFTKEEREEYDKVQKLIDYYYKTFFNQFKDVQRCLNKDLIEGYVTERNRGLNENSPLTVTKSRLLHHAFQYMLNIRKRKNLISEASAKYIKVKELIEEHKDDNIIVFSESNKFCENLFPVLPTSILYNSKITPIQKKVNLAKFDNGEVNVILASKSLDTGFSREKINVGIVASGSSKITQAKQRTGRVNRFVPEKQSYLYNLVMRSSQEEITVSNRQKENRIVYIKN